MAEHRPGRARNTVAHAACVHGQVTCEQGIVGKVIKTVVPPADTPRTTLQNVAAGENINQIIRGIVSIPLVGLEAATVGQLVYINATTNALSLTATGNVPVGRVIYLPSTMGQDDSHLRVDLDQKV
jgi:predicted RecA/RadA family phage recombinase